jgi:peptidoglycan/LPS O-acetylase OafA/YrhL
MANGDRVFGVGLLAVGAMLTLACRDYYLDGYGYGFFMTAFGYSLLALSYALLVVAALSPATALHRFRIPGAGLIALWSYSIYLSHKPLAYFLAQRLKPMGVSGGVLVGVIAAACVAMGALLYTLVEATFMALRDRWVPSNFADASVAQAKGGGALRAPAAVADPLNP